MIRDTCPMFTITDFDKPYRWYNAIMALRVLWLKKNDPETWKMLDILMDHRESTDKEDKMFDGVVDFIINVCKLKFSEQEIRHVLGVIDTNAYIIGENVSRDVDIQVIHVQDFLNLTNIFTGLIPNNIDNQSLLHCQYDMFRHRRVQVYLQSRH